MNRWVEVLLLTAAGLSLTNGQILSCTTPLKEAGTCISISKCQFLLDLFRKTNDHDKIKKVIGAYLCKNSSPNVCCASSSSIRGHNPTNQFSNSNNHFSNSNNQFSNSNNQFQYNLKSTSNCGKKNSRRILFGDDTEPGEYPWLVALGLIVQTTRFVPLCGGTLITSRHVLTAEHCFRSNNKPNIVRVGDHDLRNRNDGLDHQDFHNFKRMQGGFNTDTFENDIAVIVLNRDVDYKGGLIQPICLPFDQEHTTYNGESMEIAGWGTTESKQISWVLQEAVIRTVSVEQCRSGYTGNRAKVTDKHVCAGTGGRDSCSGDSGGPLMQSVRGKYYLIGIVSFGPTNCGDSNKPGVYTRVASWLQWIQHMVRNS